MPFPSRVPTYIENIAFGVNFSPGPFFDLIAANLPSFFVRERYLSTLSRPTRVTPYDSATTKNIEKLEASLLVSDSGVKSSKPTQYSKRADRQVPSSCGERGSLRAA